MATYNNRLNGGVCRPCSTSTTTTTPQPTPVPEEPKSPCCKDFKITAITKVKDKVVVIFDDCTFLEADLDVLDDDFNGTSSTAELETKLQDLTAKFENLTANITEVSDFSGNTRFKAFDKDFEV